MANMQGDISRGKVNDEYYTPPIAIEPLLEHIKPTSSVWCPFDTEESNIVRMLRAKGHEVIATHIWNGEDFFDIEVPDVDYIVSNPPYSRKTEVLERLMGIGKDFAMLMNVTGIFDNKRRWDCLKDKVEFMFLYPRVQYINSEGTTNCSTFQSAWLCHHVLPKQIIFREIKR